MTKLDKVCVALAVLSIIIQLVIATYTVILLSVNACDWYLGILAMILLIGFGICIYGDIQNIKSIVDWSKEDES